jgi:hypothetical protein
MIDAAKVEETYTLIRDEIDSHGPDAKELPIFRDIDLRGIGDFCKEVTPGALAEMVTSPEDLVEHVVSVLMSGVLAGVVAGRIEAMEGVE